MAFVYKYVDEDDVVQYVGKVSGSSMEALDARINAHKTDFKGRADQFKVFYAHVETPADADILETALIARLEPSFNIAKRSWGDTSFDVLVNNVNWLPYGYFAESRVLRNIYRSERDVIPCSTCGEYFLPGTGYHIEFAMRGLDVYYSIDARICAGCMPMWLPISDGIFNAIKEAQVWRNCRQPAVELLIPIDDDLTEV